MTSERILVVDDNPTNLKLAVEVLEFAGYEVLRAANSTDVCPYVKRGCVVSGTRFPMFRATRAPSEQREPSDIAER